MRAPYTFTVGEAGEPEDGPRAMFERRVSAEARVLDADGQLVATITHETVDAVDSFSADTFVVMAPGVPRSDDALALVEADAERAARDAVDAWREREWYAQVERKYGMVGS